MGLIKDPRYVNHRNQALCAGIWEFLFFTSIELENLLCTICHMWWIISLSESASYFHWSVCSGPAKYHQDVFIFGVDSPLTLSAAFSVFLPFLSLMLLKFETPFILKPQFTSPSSLESWIELTSHLSLPLSPPLSHTHTRIGMNIGDSGHDITCNWIGPTCFGMAHYSPCRMFFPCLSLWILSACSVWKSLRK